MRCFWLGLGEAQSKLSWNFSGISWQSLIWGRRRHPEGLDQSWEGGFCWGLNGLKTHSPPLQERQAHLSAPLAAVCRAECSLVLG